MNKYLKRGLVWTVAGLLMGGIGVYMKDSECAWYKMVLIVSVLLFGLGFVTIIYSLIRKIERQSMVEEREKKQHDLLP